MTNEERKQFQEKVRSLMAELCDFDKVAAALNMTSVELQRILNSAHIGAYTLCPPAHVLAKMYAENMPIHSIRRKTRIPIDYILRALQEAAGYKTFAERFGNTPYDDIAKQAAFCKDRDRLIALYYKRGWTIADLEIEFGLPYNFLKQILKEAGFKFEEAAYVRPRQPSLHVMKRNKNIYNLYKAGIPKKILADKYGLSASTIENIIYRSKIEENPAAVKPKPSKIKFRKKF